MNKFFSIFIFIFFAQISFAQNLFVADTFTYTINLDLSQNLYLKSVPQDLLKGYCKGEWNAYYPKKEMNQCLFDDFLHRFDYYQLEIPDSNGFCFDDYCSQAYFDDIYKQFTRKLRYKEVLYFDKNHSIIKREVLWVQVYFSRLEANGWKHYDGPVFWLREINKSYDDVVVKNKNLRSIGWSLDKEFGTPGFITNENQQKDDKKKLNKVLQTEEY
jgi:hypothetical protein